MNDSIYMQFSSTEQIGQAFIQDGETLFAVVQRLQNAMNNLYASGLQGAFLDELQMRSEQLLSTLRYFCDESDEAGQELLMAARLLREVDAACARRFANIGNRGTSGTPVNAVNPHMEGITSQSWYKLHSQIDGGWNGAHPSQAKAIVVNGIQNSPEDLQGLMNLTSDNFGNVPVLGVYNATDGKNRMGAARDSLQATMDKFQVWSGVRLGPENPAVFSLMRAIQETGGTVPIVAHSQGGAITAAALWELHNQGYDLSHLKVITMGSAEFSFPQGERAPHYDHRVNLNDVVPMVAGGRAAYYYFNPVTLAKHLITGEVKILPSLNIYDTHSAKGYIENF